MAICEKPTALRPMANIFLNAVVGSATACASDSFRVAHEHSRLLQTTVLQSFQPRHISSQAAAKLLRLHLAEAAEATAEAARRRRRRLVVDDVALHVVAL